jgi:ubiquinone/menaquinone biosynthesis C-methylase UbiE
VTPDEFLLAYHAQHAGATARSFAGGRTADGRSTYQLLADLPAAGDRVLDLGCGDGYLLELLAARGCRALVGVDMSAAELATAARRPALAGVRLIEARARSLPLAEASFDWVVSHLAFMLMSEVEAVVGELARVLRPGGRFATVVGGGPAAEDDAFALFLRLFQAEYERCAERAPRLGDRRTRDAAGLAALLHPAFEPDIEESAYVVRLDAGAERLWEILGENPVYEMLALPAAAALRIRAGFLAEAPALARADGSIPCALRGRLLVARRAT